MSEPLFRAEDLHIVSDGEPMELVRLARQEGREVRLVTGCDPATPDALFVAWHIPSLDVLVFEGFRGPTTSSPA